MHLKKRMRTVIITGSRIKKIFLLFVVVCFIGVLLLISNIVSDVSGPSGDLGIKIISGEVNDNKVGFKEFIYILMISILHLMIAKTLQGV